MTTEFTEVERRWLEYCWRVVNWPRSHESDCHRAGGSRQDDTPEGRHEDLRWPGYLGRNFTEDVGILCAGAVGRRDTRFTELEPERRWAYDETAATVRSWLAAGRSPSSDADFLEGYRRIYEAALPHWDRWNNVFRKFVEDYMGMDRSQIAWASLAKCRADLDANAERVATACQRVFPAREMVAAVRPAVVLVCVLNARVGGRVVPSWTASGVDPIVWAFHGRNARGQDGRPFAEWGPELAARIRAK